jgi:hypothetical protein
MMVEGPKFRLWFDPAAHAICKIILLAIAEAPP